MCRLSWSALFVLCSFLFTEGSTCKLPVDLQTSVWEYTDRPGNTRYLSFDSSNMTGFDLFVSKANETLNSFTCISNVDNVFAFRSTNSYYDADDCADRYLFLCMRLTKMSSDLFYFYLLSDIDSSQDVIPSERVLNPPYDNIPVDTNPTCHFCNYTTAPPDSDVRILRRKGSGISKPLPSGVRPCLPCQATCSSLDPCTCNKLHVDKLYAGRQFEYIATVKNGDDFIPTNPPAGYKFSVIQVLAVCKGETPYNNLARMNTKDPVTFGVSCPNAFYHLLVGETYVFYGTMQTIEGRRSFVVDWCTPPAKTTARTCPKII